MKLRHFALQNVRSFAERAELNFDGDISIIVGPNGGGKTNLLDALTSVLRKYFLVSWVYREVQQNNVNHIQFYQNDQVFNTHSDKYSGHESLPQEFAITFEVGSIDIRNMREMEQTKADISAHALSEKYLGLENVAHTVFFTDAISAGTLIAFTVNDQQVSRSDQLAAVFLNYMQYFELFRLMREDMKLGDMTTPILSLPVNRASGEFQSSVTLAAFNDVDYKRQVDAANSKINGSLVALALGRIADRFQTLLYQDDGQARKKFRSDPQMVALSSILKDIGYTWDLVSTNIRNNTYDIKLTKQGSSFLVGSASSGEKELFTYLFGIYALNVRDALIVVDEPELHLHPRWQTILLGVFERLAKETGNQFILATHSSTFISPASISYVSRVFSRDQRSSIVRLQDADLPDKKHLFGIVNSQSNERIFFTQRVILVEGLSDRLFFEKLFSELYPERTSNYEIVSVGGKSFFVSYAQILKSCKIDFYIIADLDYVTDIGTPSVRQLFSVNHSAIRRDIIENPSSVDGANIVARLEEAIASCNVADLKQLWDYIKARKTKLRTDLNEDERNILDLFIDQSRSLGTFILKLGSIENYLPLGYRSKDLDKLIRLLEKPKLLDDIETVGRDELTDIARIVMDPDFHVR
ncbi:hypothetical protein GCM10007036_02870 [Alsobacter metallidurans]|uniref:Uncharacterized protein n=1 Tax=Alsobacter metallidurans TaxID=340221 RepID=A0A917I3X9_9HYPH|nr:AAA family ATPase [Alsobacter metallidurans]GGH07783.1 hypothetical protein GCM10007036_02870 [Alsobacter metallidurans]